MNMTPIGDWMGSLYDVAGRRWDYHLFLGHDDTYERIERREPDFERKDSGYWQYHEEDKVLELKADPKQFGFANAENYRVLYVSTCEDSNVLLVLRPLVLGSRIVPILFYRVHSGNRAYGTGWLDRLKEQQQDSASPHDL